MPPYGGGGKGCGGFQRSGPTGGRAYGIPRKARTDDTGLNPRYDLPELSMTIGAVSLGAIAAAEGSNAASAQSAWVAGSREPANRMIHR